MQSLEPTSSIGNLTSGLETDSAKCDTACEDNNEDIYSVLDPLKTKSFQKIS